MGNPFGVSLPPLSTAEALAVDVRPASLRRWVSTLNLQMLGESTRQLYEQLQLINRVELTPRVRFDWAESLQDPLQAIVARLCEHYRNKPFPLSEKAMAVAQLSNALHEEMIFAYRRILSSHPDTSLLGRGSDRLMRQIACFRMFVHAGEILSNYQMMYTPPPPGMWRHLHAYYARIRSQGWANTPISGVAAPATLEHLYRRTILLALLPKQLVPMREWQKIAGKIDAWLALPHLLEARQRTTNRAQYCIRFELDTPVAGATDRCCPACDNRLVGMLLDTAPLIAELQHYRDCQIDADNRAADEEWPAPETIQMLLRAWHIPEAARQPRTPVDLPLTIVSGLDNIHTILAEEARTTSTSSSEENTSTPNFSVPELTLADVKSRPVFSAFPEEAFLGQRDPEQDVWKLSYGEEKFMETPPAWYDAPRKEMVDALTARAVDASATGYRLEMALPKRSTLRLGELIAVRGTSTKGWELFLLRWVRRIDSERVTLGMERLGDGLHAIDLIVQGSDSTQAVLRAITVIDEERIPLLLMPKLPSHTRKRFAIRNSGVDTPITLAEKLGHSPLFESYLYSSNNPLAERTQAGETPGRNEDPFNEVWRLL